MRTSTVRAGAVAVALIATVAAEGADPKLFDPRYERVVWLYARGQHAEAVRELGEVPWTAIDAAAKLLELRHKSLRECTDCPDDVLDHFPLRAATMLHFDRDVAERPPNVVIERVPTCSQRHARRAAEFARLLATRKGEAEFSRRFHLAMAERAQWDACLDEAIDWWTRDGLALFPGDPELLLAKGASHEKFARLSDQPPARQLERARQALAAAVDAAPTNALARVHLGRVSWQLGQLDAARAALEPAARADGEYRTRYLAWLFLGQVHERAGRTTEAEAAFREALAIDPDGQSAAIALAHSLLMRGEGAAARQIVERATGRPPDHFDAHWNYLSNNAESSEDRIQALREESRR